MKIKQIVGKLMGMEMANNNQEVKATTTAPRNRF